MVLIKPLMTEKLLKLVESENKIAFEVERKANKSAIKQAVEKMFNVKVVKVNTMIRKNKKIAIVKLAKENPAIDLATQLGII